MKEEEKTYTCRGKKIFQEGEFIGRRCGKDGSYCDLKGLIEAFPFDGKNHFLKCRGCGTKSKIHRTELE